MTENEEEMTALSETIERFEYKGYQCLIRKNLHMGILLGYVGLPEGHKFYGKYYDKLERHIEVHGGVTFADFFHNGEVERDLINSGLWWIGFDCGHWMDVIPNFQLHDYPGATYKDADFVRKEIKSMVDQLEK